MILKLKYIKFFFISIILICSSFFLFKSKFLYLDQYFLKFYNFIYNKNLKIEDKVISIKGSKYINENDIISDIELLTDNFKNENYIQIIYDNLKKNNLIRNFSIIKKSKRLIEIEIVEKVMIGIFVENGKIYLIDNGNNLNVIHKTNDFVHLPYFFGVNAYINASKILQLIKKADINFAIHSLEYIGQRRWNLNLKNKVKILLSEKNLLNNLKSLKYLHQRYNILNGNFVEIDLRINNKYFFKPKISKDIKINN